MSGLITGIAGLAITAGTTTASFIQAGKQKKLQKQAERDAEKSMEQARKALGVNYFEDLAIQKEKYELERDATLQAQAGATQAMQEGGARAVASGVGRVALAGQQQQAQTRTAMGKELSELQQLTAQEDTRLRDLGVQLDLEEAAGAQQAAANAAEMRAAKIGEGIEGAMSVAQQGLSMVPLYQQNRSAQKAAVGSMQFTPEEFAKFGNVMGKDGGVSRTMGQAGGEGFTNLDLGAVGNMTNKQFRQFKQELTPQQRAQLFNTQYFENYNSQPNRVNPFQL